MLSAVLRLLRRFLRVIAVVIASLITVPAAVATTIMASFLFLPLPAVIPASQLERTMPKQEILFKYLSSVYFGDQAYGVGAAAQTYFRKSVNDLTLSEAAMLAGLIPAPSRWAPRENLVEAEFHRNLVLNQMLEQRVITQAEHDKAAAQHLFLVSSGAKPPANATLVYPVEQTAVKYPDFVDYVYRYVVAKYGPNTVLRGGLDTP